MAWCDICRPSPSLRWQYDAHRVKALSDRLVERIRRALPDVVRNGDDQHTYPGCVNLSFAYVEGEW